jgi:hypothetical protein
MSNQNLLQAPEANNYRRIASPGNYEIKLDAKHACAVLKAYDYGVDALSSRELHDLDMVIAKLKDEIWP